jgi:hypothetical protein
MMCVISWGDEVGERAVAGRFSSRRSDESIAFHARWAQPDVAGQVHVGDAAGVVIPSREERKERGRVAQIQIVRVRWHVERRAAHAALRRRGDRCGPIGQRRSRVQHHVLGAHLVGEDDLRSREKDGVGDRPR